MLQPASPHNVLTLYNWRISWGVAEERTNFDCVISRVLDAARGQDELVAIARVETARRQHGRLLTSRQRGFEVRG
jgi:hypothetical protein